ncbi:MAG: hypothetical protein LBK53_05160 [Heliobacteriaceae bacterium]|nr:hypothetical protein [Heliobacteriaceae bacterium]
MIIKKRLRDIPQDEPAQKKQEPEENTADPEKIDLFDLDNIDFKQRQERRRGDRRRGFRRIDDRNLISRAREEAQSIKESAAKEGYEEGLAQARTDLDEIRNALGAFINAKQEVFDYIAPNLLEIGLDIAQKVIKKEIAQSPAILMENVTEILKGLSRDEAKITIQANPAQAALLKQEIPASAESFGIEAKILIIPDETIYEGGCMITTTNGVIDATIETQLSIISEALKEI